MTLTVRDNDGATNSISKILQVKNTPPIADFNFTWNKTYTFNHPTDADIIRFIDNSTDSDGSIVAWKWSFDDPSTSDEQNPLHLFVDDGTYNVTLTIWDDDGASATITKEITIVNVPPIANFTWKPTAPIVSQNISFNDLSSDIDGVIVNYTWDFGDDSPPSYEQNPTHAYTLGGNYTVTLTITDDDNSKSSISKNISVENHAPTADFTWTPVDPTDLDNINFTDLSTDLDGNIVNWTWDFGDGNTSYEQNPQHKYKDNGPYMVTLTVRDLGHLTDSITKTIIVYNVPPVANFTWEPKTPTDKDMINFTDQSTDLNGEIKNWTWDFGDGSPPSYEQNPQHQYEDNGIFNITLTVVDDDGDSNTTTKTVVVGNLPPTADFIWNPLTISANQTVNFTDQSTDLDGEIVNWTWDFGDGNISYEQNPTHVYIKKGTYNVTLTIRDNDNATDDVTKTINVNIPPVAKFNYCPLYPKVNDSILFIDGSYDPDGQIINYTWSFGDGNISYEKNPRHTYTEAGNYIVNLTVKDELGAISWYEKTVTVAT